MFARIANECRRSPSSLPGVCSTSSVMLSPYHDVKNRRRYWAGEAVAMGALANPEPEISWMQVRDALASGNPAAYLSRLPVQIDGSCNGLQHYAALGRDKAGGNAVNLRPAPAPQVRILRYPFIFFSIVWRSAGAGPNAAPSPCGPRQPADSHPSTFFPLFVWRLAAIGPEGMLSTCAVRLRRRFFAPILTNTCLTAVKHLGSFTVWLGGLPDCFSTLRELFYHILGSARAA